MWLTVARSLDAKVSRSPGRRSEVSRSTGTPNAACCFAVRGRIIWNRAITY
jgi:hypothetical protein